MEPPPTQRVFEREAVGYPGTGFAEVTTVLLKVSAWTLPSGVGIALISAWDTGMFIGLGEAPEDLL